MDSSSGEVKQEDAYRSFLYGESEKDTKWRHGAPPQYHLVNNLFQQSRTKEWAKGSLEEIVQNVVKTWEMELSHKERVQDFKSIDHDKFKISVNGGPALSAEETLAVGSYNALLSTSLAGEHESYKASVETFESSHDVFREAFPSGFAWEVLEVYSGPPTVAFKWRHWGKMEGSFKGHAPIGQIVESFGTCIAKVDENLKIVNLEVFYDPTQFLGGLTRGPKSTEYTVYRKGIEGCPLHQSIKQ